MSSAVSNQQNITFQSNTHILYCPNEMSDLEPLFHSLCIRQLQVILSKPSTVKYVIFYSFFPLNISDLWGNESVS